MVDKGNASGTEIVMRYATSYCSVEGCEDRCHGRGYCRVHYKRWQRHGDPLGGGPSPQSRAVRSCSVEDCTAKHYARSYCQVHYARWRAHGDPLVVVTPDKIRHPKRSPAAAWASFLARLDGYGESQCWEWTGATDPNGYGRLAWNDRLWLAHRVSYTQHVGPIPDGISVCHRCDNPPCCNPAHLFLGTHADNVRDMWAKGRGKTPTTRHGAS